MHEPQIFTNSTPAQNEADRARHFNLSLDLLCIAGLDGYFKEVNPSWTRVLGWSRAELLASPVDYFMHPEDRERTLQARANLAKGIPLLHLENRYRCKDGSYRWLSWQSSTVPGSTTVIGVARDITERRQIELDQSILGKLQSTGILAGGIAHDFNNLLTAIMLNVEMIRLTGDVNSNQLIHIQQALDTALAAHAITQQLLTFASGGNLIFRPTDLGGVLRQAFERTLNGSGCRGDIQIDADLWLVDLDEAQIDQVFRNVFLNASDAMPQGGTVTVHAENIDLTASHPIELPNGKYVHVSVADEGGGIKPEILSKIFDPYFSTKLRGSQKGMGLGLTVCHSIIQKHGGLISVESKLGNGTTIHCYLPTVQRRATAMEGEQGDSI